MQRLCLVWLILDIRQIQKSSDLHLKQQVFTFSSVFLKGRVKNATRSCAPLAYASIKLN